VINAGKETTYEMHQETRLDGQRHECYLRSNPGNIPTCTLRHELVITRHALRGHRSCLRQL